ncbi:hypothetical protein D3C81_928400 [compost metagenome]
MPALLTANGVRAARILRLGLQGIVAALAVTLADRMDGREIQHVKTHVTDHRQTFMHVIEGAMACWIIGNGAGKQLIPAGEQGLAPFDVQRILRAAAEECAVVGLAHQHGGIDVQQLGNLRFGRQGGQRVMQALQLLAQQPLAALDVLLKQLQAFLHLQRHGHPSGELLLQVMAVSGEGVDPGLDAEQVSALLDNGEVGLPQVVAGEHHRHAVPATALGLSPVEHYRQAVMPIGIDLAAHLYRLTDYRLDREHAAVQ